MSNAEKSSFISKLKKPFRSHSRSSSLARAEGVKSTHSTPSSSSSGKTGNKSVVSGAGDDKDAIDSTGVAANDPRSKSKGASAHDSSEGRNTSKTAADKNLMSGQAIGAKGAYIVSSNSMGQLKSRNFVIVDENTKPSYSNDAQQASGKGVFYAGESSPKIDTHSDAAVIELAQEEGQRAAQRGFDESTSKSNNAEAPSTKKAAVTPSPHTLDPSKEHTKNKSLYNAEGIASAIAKATGSSQKGNSTKHNGETTESNSNTGNLTTTNDTSIAKGSPHSEASFLTEAVPPSSPKFDYEAEMKNLDHQIEHTQKEIEELKNSDYHVRSDEAHQTTDDDTHGHSTSSSGLIGGVAGSLAAAAAGSVGLAANSKNSKVQGPSKESAVRDLHSDASTAGVKTNSKDDKFIPNAPNVSATAAVAETPSKKELNAQPVSADGDNTGISAAALESSKKASSASQSAPKIVPDSAATKPQPDLPSSATPEVGVSSNADHHLAQKSNDAGVLQASYDAGFQKAKSLVHSSKSKGLSSTSSGGIFHGVAASLGFGRNKSIKRNDSAKKEIESPILQEIDTSEYEEDEDETEKGPISLVKKPNVASGLPNDNTGENSYGGVKSGELSDTTPKSSAKSAVIAGSLVGAVSASAAKFAYDNPKAKYENPQGNYGKIEGKWTPPVDEGDSVLGKTEGTLGKLEGKEKVSGKTEGNLGKLEGENEGLAKTEGNLGKVEGDTKGLAKTEGNLGKVEGDFKGLAKTEGNLGNIEGQKEGLTKTEGNLGKVEGDFKGLAKTEGNLGKLESDTKGFAKTEGATKGLSKTEGNLGKVEGDVKGLAKTEGNLGKLESDTKGFAKTEGNLGKVEGDVKGLAKTEGNLGKVEGETKGFAKTEGNLGNIEGQKEGLTKTEGNLGKVEGDFKGLAKTEGNLGKLEGDTKESAKSEGNLGKVEGDTKGFAKTEGNLGKLESDTKGFAKTEGNLGKIEGIKRGLAKTEGTLGKVEGDIKGLAKTEGNLAKVEGDTKGFAETEGNLGKLESDTKGFAKTEGNLGKLENDTKSFAKTEGNLGKLESDTKGFAKTEGATKGLSKTEGNLGKVEGDVKGLAKTEGNLGKVEGDTKGFAKTEGNLGNIEGQKEGLTKTEGNLGKVEGSLITSKDVLTKKLGQSSKDNSEVFDATHDTSKSAGIDHTEPSVNHSTNGASGSFSSGTATKVLSAGATGAAIVGGTAAVVTAAAIIGTGAVAGAGAVALGAGYSYFASSKSGKESEDPSPNAPQYDVDKRSYGSPVQNVGFFDTSVHSDDETDNSEVAIAKEKTLQTEAEIHAKGTTGKSSYLSEPVVLASSHSKDLGSSSEFASTSSPKSEYYSPKSEYYSAGVEKAAYEAGRSTGSSRVASKPFKQPQSLEVEVIGVESRTEATLLAQSVSKGLIEKGYDLSSGSLVVNATTGKVILNHTDDKTPFSSPTEAEFGLSGYEIESPVENVSAHATPRSLHGEAEAESVPSKDSIPKGSQAAVDKKPVVLMPGSFYD